MAANRARFTESLSTAREILRAHSRAVLPLALVVVVGLAALALVSALYAQLIGVTAYPSLVDATSVEALTAGVAAVLAPLILLALAAALTWAGTAAHAATGRVSLRSAAWVSFRRSPRALAVILATIGAAAAAIIATPILVIVGVVGLLARRGDRQKLVPMAIPFGAAVLVLVRWSLALPAVWLDGAGVRQALATSSARVRGRGVPVALTLLAAALAAVGISEGAAALTPPDFALLTRVIALIVVGALPFVAMTVLYRHGEGRMSPSLPKPMARRARIATAVVLSLVLPTLVATAPAGAAEAASGTPVTLSKAFAATLTGQDFLIFAQVDGAAPTGTVRFEAVPSTGPAVVLGTAAIDTSGYTFLAAGTALAPDEYQLVGYYSGDAGNPAGTSDPLAHTVTDPTAQLDVTSTPAATGDAATLAITVTAISPAVEGPTGTVTVSGVGTFPLVDGAVSVPVDIATLGTRELTVTYSGDAVYASRSVLYTVPRIVTTTRVFGPSFRAATYGDTLTIEGTVSTTTGTVPTGTVELWWYGQPAASATLVDGAFTITTDTLRVADQRVFLAYLGDAQHAPSDDSADAARLDIAKVTSVPVVAITPADPTIGDTATLTATLADRGTGPTGLVTFTANGGTLLGTATPVDGVASLAFVPTALTTFVTASFAGDINYTAQPSDPLRVDSARAPVTVTLDGPDAVAVGDVFDLTAEVEVAGGALAPSHGVDFGTATGLVLADDVPVTAGTARVTVCAGAAADCPAGILALGRNDLDLVATYGESSVNLAGTSAVYAYTAGKSATTTTLQVNPTTISYGSAIQLTATVAGSGSATPTGYVTFYGIEPVAGGGEALQFLGSATLDESGVARFTTQSGTGVDDLRWPADGIRAFYSPAGAPFLSSRDDVAVAIGRVATTVEVLATGTAAGTPTPITVRLSHAAGTSADFTGQVVVTADSGATCSGWLTGGARSVTCSITWSTPGTHTVSATYSGDSVYLPGTSDVLSVTGGKRTPALGASAPVDVLVDTDVTVGWNRFDAAATGTVTVWGDGARWCEVSVQDLACIGRFGNASATGGYVDVVVRYSGDATYLPIEQVLKVKATRCAVLDVRANDLTLGSVGVTTAPNCGAAGYRPGSTVTVKATPFPGAEFAFWQEYRGASTGLVPGSTSQTLTFLVTNDPSSWVRVATFRVPCYPVTAQATGNGGISVYPASNCTTDAGTAGWLRGTAVGIYPDGHPNPTYGEADAFYSFDTLPDGATRSTDSSGRPLLRLTVTQPAVVGLTFGPVCRPVEVTFSPASSGDSATFEPAQNCASPVGNGYLRGTRVTASATPGDPTLAIAGWSLGGVPAPELGTTSTPSVVVDTVVPRLTASLVHCYTVEVVADGATDARGREVGQVRVEGAPNCPDGSPRYLTGTTVTLTPEILVDGAGFTGWDDARTAPATPTGGVGDVTSRIRTVVVEKNLRTVAGFYLDAVCSKLTVVGDPKLLSFLNTGCGEGYYFDLQKQSALRNDVEQSTLWQSKYRSELAATVNRTQKLDVYATVRGDTRGCFGSTPASSGPGSASDSATFGPVSDSAATCRVGGPVTVSVQACQTVATAAALHVAGRSGNFDASELPGTFYLQNSDGSIGAFTMDGFRWAQAIPISVQKDGTARQEAPAPGPCGTVGNAFPANTDFALIAAGPTAGFVFDGWSGLGTPGLLAQNPIRRITTNTQRVLPATASYTITCNTVTFGEGIQIVGEAPRCPGSSEADNSFIAGAAIQVKALQHIGDRVLAKFTSGVVAGQISEDPATKELIGFAMVDGDKKVSALYQTGAEHTTQGVLQGLKFSTGILAIATPIFVGMLFPPAGIFFSVVGLGAGIANLIPGGDKVAAVFDLVDPTKITTCVARWSFTNAGDPTGGANVGSMISTANTIRKVVNGVDVFIEPIGPLGTAGGLASFGYGLYDAGIGSAEFGPQTVEELADSAGLTNCLDAQWRGAPG